MNAALRLADHAQPASDLPAEQQSVSFADLDALHVAATFRFPGSIWADRVELGGDFTTDPLPMTYARDDDEWQATVVLARGRVFCYWYLLDGQERCFDCDAHIETPPAVGVPAPLPLLPAAPQ